MRPQNVICRNCSFQRLVPIRRSTLSGLHRKCRIPNVIVVGKATLQLTADSNEHLAITVENRGILLEFAETNQNKLHLGILNQETHIGCRAKKTIKVPDKLKKKLRIIRSSKNTLFSMFRK